MPKQPLRLSDTGTDAVDATQQVASNDPAFAGETSAGQTGRYRMNLVTEEHFGTTLRVTMDGHPAGTGFVWQVTSEAPGRPAEVVAGAATPYASPVRCASDAVEALKNIIDQRDRGQP